MQNRTTGTFNQQMLCHRRMCWDNFGYDKKKYLKWYFMLTRTYKDIIFTEVFLLDLLSIYT